MSSINKNRNILRAATLVLFIVTILGPWMFDVIHVPAQYECDKPFVRLSDDYCGISLSGFDAFKLFVGGFFNSLFELITGAFTGGPSELFTGLALLPMVPFISTILLLWKDESHQLQTVNLLAWSLALIPTLGIFFFQIGDQVLRLWGLWLYILMTIGAVITEVLIQRTRGTSN
jgi:hypothetical protein